MGLDATNRNKAARKRSLRDRREWTPLALPPAALENQDGLATSLARRALARSAAHALLASAGPCGAACSLGGLRCRRDLTCRGVREGSSASWPPSPEGSGRRCCGGRWVRSFTVRAAEQIRGVQGEGAQKDGTRGPITCHTLGQGAQVCLTWALTAKSEALDARGQDVHRRRTLRPPATPGDPRTVGTFEGLVAHGVCLGEPIRRKPAPRCVKNDPDTPSPSTPTGRVSLT